MQHPVVPPPLQQQQQQQCGSSSAARGSGEGEPSTRPSASGALGYDEALLTGGDGCEQQFEEARAAAWVRAMQANRGTTEPGPEPIHNAGAVCAVPTGRAKPHSPTAAPVPAAAACAAALPRAGEGAATMQARPLPLAPLIPAAGNSGAGATSGASELLPLPGRALPHATRGTAQQQQQQQQRAPAHGQQAGQQQSSGAGAACTMATSGASRPSSSSSWPDSQSSAPPFAAPAPTPAGHAPVLPSAPPAGHSGHYAEPTVTLSTRAAFDVLNDMFNDAPAPRGGSNAMPPPPPSSQQQQQQQVGSWQPHEVRLLVDMHMQQWPAQRVACKEVADNQQAVGCEAASHLRVAKKAISHAQSRASVLTVPPESGIAVTDNESDWHD